MDNIVGCSLQARGVLALLSLLNRGKQQRRVAVPSQSLSALEEKSKEPRTRSQDDRKWRRGGGLWRACKRPDYPKLAVIYVHEGAWNRFATDKLPS